MRSEISAAANTLLKQEGLMLAEGSFHDKNMSYKISPLASQDVPIF